ncbi:hypothetical protein CIB84_000708 [Bambusicola thoracicus]|uniref:Uncharacterized protein n=1 Tax=Bambusicola thoracicus TaxID=9083 RepID=A0A2P4TGQ7_BAMTH|nr:hypothetical protein CIB84_000708 [Bambusicola thoracicus]
MESRAANASNKEISIQWYVPSLAKPTNDADTKVKDIQTAVFDERLSEKPRSVVDSISKEMATKCLSEVKALLSAVPVLTLPLTEIPFDITLQSIASLEDMFDLANGCTVTEESLFSWIISLFH